MMILLAVALLAPVQQHSPAPAASAVAALPSPERRQELLFEAARLGRVDLIEPLMKAGANINAHDARGFTPLILAAYNGQSAMVDTLLAHDADPCRADLGQGNTAQMGVAFKGNDALAARLLKTNCDVNARNKVGQTALMMAALFGRTAQVSMLLAAGADPGIADATGRTAASVAAGQGHEGLVAVLASHSR